MYRLAISVTINKLDWSLCEITSNRHLFLLPRNLRALAVQKCVGLDAQRVLKFNLCPTTEYWSSSGRVVATGGGKIYS